jgi:hypothetical protein
MKRKKSESRVERRKENILQLLDSMAPDKLGLVHGIILTAMLIQESTEKRKNGQNSYS